MFSAIQNPDLPRIDIDNIVKNCWTVYDSLELSEMEDNMDIFEIILKSSGVRMIHIIGWRKDYFMPTFPLRSYEFDNEEQYNEICSYSNMMDQLNSGDTETLWKQKLRDYLRWLGYSNKL